MALRRVGQPTSLVETIPQVRPAAVPLVNYAQAQLRSSSSVQQQQVDRSRLNWNTSSGQVGLLSWDGPFLRQRVNMGGQVSNRVAGIDYANDDARYSPMVASGQMSAGTYWQLMMKNNVLNDKDQLGDAGRLRLTSAPPVSFRFNSSGGGSISSRLGGFTF
jgi:hypothetical protein